MYVILKRFIHIISHMRTLGKVFQNEDMVIKVLRCSNRSWKPKVTLVSKSRDLSSMEFVTPEAEEGGEWS